MEPDGDLVARLVRAAGVDELCARVLANRGVLPENAAGFLRPNLGSVSPPEEDPWRVAARRIREAIRRGERIGIFGDYDTDGITSAAVLYLALSRYTQDLCVRLPVRQVGYGLLEPYVRDLFADGVRLLVTADCGVSNRSEVELAASLGMDVIVTDHHIPPQRLPEAAVTVLDPKVWDPEDPLAGVGVAWKLAWAVARELEGPEARRWLGELLDLVSVGTVVDIAPLVGDNRVLASTGLRHLNRALSGRRARPGLEALVRVAGLRNGVDEEDLGWRIGPRINSIGRLKDPGPALELLLTSDRREALRIASLLNQLNAERQRRTELAVARALPVVDPEQDFKVVVTDETGGLAGLIAGRVASATGRPAAVLGRRADGSYGGSARAGETEVDLYGALLEVRDLLGEWGGHRKAAGLTVTPGNLEAFTGRVNAAVRRQRAVDPEIFEPAVEVDAEVALEMVDDDLLGWHERLAPFGSGNYRPVFAAGGLRIERSRQLWEGMNLLTLRGGLRARLACDPEGLPEGSFDAVFTVYRSRYTGVAEMEIVDWRR
ncbi:Single-stranded-DNA-specific exonuclease RecJ [Rubrobacter xylanophilus DSM 9941]|uniref:single-stranded-DNA-specific exonuclease RecJ n=1 Tax=Rubrobacter xylanophilus TaxID=49319 RepID=UPI001C642D4D|nr:DHH family phosphoesterase [Rubrobacter xylanophilus]QYJ17091.1 Single-stranded-DNA-specific exonuclease RecJ [Rubrobacter xylanophilus DSM 9941]